MGKIMEKKAKDTSNTKARDKELYQAYLNAIEKHREVSSGLSKEKLVELAIHTPPSQFFISQETARKIITRELKKKNKENIL